MADVCVLHVRDRRHMGRMQESVSTVCPTFSRMGDERVRKERAFFRDPPISGQSRSYFAQLITSVKPRDRMKFMAIAPEVLPPPRW
jgi:hypothetical protein